jgi:SnoaL-like domain
MTMILDLPKPVAAYFTADLGDGEGLSQCFTEHAIVKDEGHTYRGRAAIKQWKEEASAKYQYTCEPFACDHSAGKVVVTCKLTGNFAGSPLNLRFFFELAGDKLASLEVIP